MSYAIKHYHSEHGFKTVIVGPAGRKYIPLLVMDKQLTVLNVPLREARYLKDLCQTKKQRTVKSAARFFRAYGAKVGATKKAKLFVKAVLKS